MAKRRNLKKEKAIRNEEYARRFRKRSQGNRRRTSNQSNSPNSEQSTETSSGEGTG